MSDMKYAFEITSGGMICIPSFVKMDSGVKILLRWIRIQTHRQEGDVISLLFCSNKESWLKIHTSCVYVIHNVTTQRKGYCICIVDALNRRHFSLSM
jgi:hypothetical protein